MRMKKTLAATTNMTQGSPLRLILSFAIPLLLSSVCQQLYSFVDSLVVGRLIGVEAFAAVGASYPYYWFVFAIVLGFAQGFGVLFAQRFGANDTEGVKNAVGQSIVVAAAFSLGLTALFLPLIRPALALIGTPAEITNDAAGYLAVLIGSMTIFFFGNVAMALLRSLGNSRAPLYSVILSSIVNIVLDLVFVALFGWGLPGAALATVLGAACSLVYCLFKLAGMPTIRPQRSHLTYSPQVVRELMRLGFPIAFQSMVINSGALVVQWFINGYGTTYIAGITAANRYFGILTLVSFALDGAVVVYVGQNFGAGRYDRIRMGVRTSVWIAVISSLSIAAIAVVFGRSMIALLINAEPALMEQIIQIGYQTLLANTLCLPALYLLFVFRSSLQGMGNTVIPMASGFTELATRLVSVILLTRIVGVWGIYIADGLGWITAALLLGFSYRVVFRKKTAGASI